MKNGLLTTGEVAKLLCLSPRTVAKLCDRGELKSWKKPGTEHRVIPYDDLYRFAKDSGYPIKYLYSNSMDVVSTIVFSEANVESFSEMKENEVRVVFADSAVMLGYLLAQNIRTVNRLILNLAEGESYCLGIMYHIKSIAPDMVFECISYPDTSESQIKNYAKAYRVEQLRKNPYLIMR